MREIAATSLTEEQLAHIVYSAIDVNSFAVLDALCAGNIPTTIDNIDAAAHDQTSWNEFIGMMYR
jgi:hypothetical protein